MFGLKASGFQACWCVSWQSRTDALSVCCRPAGVWLQAGMCHLPGGPLHQGLTQATSRGHQHPTVRFTVGAQHTLLPLVGGGTLVRNVSQQHVGAVLQLHQTSRVFVSVQVQVLPGTGRPHLSTAPRPPGTVTTGVAHRRPGVEATGIPMQAHTVDITTPMQAMVRMTPTRAMVTPTRAMVTPMQATASTAPRPRCRLAHHPLCPPAPRRHCPATQWQQQQLLPATLQQLLGARQLRRRATRPGSSSSSWGRPHRREQQHRRLLHMARPLPRSRRSRGSSRSSRVVAQTPRMSTRNSCRRCRAADDIVLWLNFVVAFPHRGCLCSSCVRPGEMRVVPRQPGCHGAKKNPGVTDRPASLLTG